MASLSAVERLFCCSLSVFIDCIIGSCAGVDASAFGSAFALALLLACGDLDLGPLALAGPNGTGNAACVCVASCLNSSAGGLVLDLIRLACIRDGGGGDGDCMLYLMGSCGCVGTAGAGGCGSPPPPPTLVPSVISVISAATVGVAFGLFSKTSLCLDSAMFLFCSSRNCSISI